MTDAEIDDEIQKFGNYNPELFRVLMEMINDSKFNLSDRLAYINITAPTGTSVLFGRRNTATGDWEEISLGTNLSMSGTTLNASGGGSLSDGDKGDITVSGSGATWTIDNAAVTYAKIVNGTALSVLGRSANTSGVNADITAGSDFQILRRNGTTIAFGSIDLSQTNAVGTSRLLYANMIAPTTTSLLLGRRDSSTGNWEEITLGTNLSMSGTTLNAAGGGGSISDGDKGDITVSSSGTVWTVDNSAITHAKYQDIAGLSVICRATTTTGVVGVQTGTADQVFRVNGAGNALTFGAIDISKSAAVTGVLASANGGAGTINGILKANGSGTTSLAQVNVDYSQAMAGIVQMVPYYNNTNTLTTTGAVTTGYGLVWDPTNHILDARRDVSATNSGSTIGRFTVISSGDMTDGFGGGLAFYIRDNANVDNVAGSFSYIRDGADNSAKWVVFNNKAGTNTCNLNIASNGNASFGNGTTSGNSTVQITGSFATSYVEKTALYTLTASDYTVNVTSGTHTQTLPTAVGIAGRIYNITNSGSGTVTVGTTSSQTFVNQSGTPTTISLGQFHGVTVQSTGANWIVLSIF